MRRRSHSSALPPSRVAPIAPKARPDAGMRDARAAARKFWRRSRSSWTAGAAVFPWRPSDASVLEAAERAGLELPFSCRSGICATCRARIVDGEAVMAHNIALQPWEIEAGFVLCCQARPTTATLELSYDEK